jgi:hypothetical protein
MDLAVVDEPDAFWSANLVASLIDAFVWYVVMHRPERWASGRYQVDSD